jgi:proline iminopeptidase
MRVWLKKWQFPLSVFDAALTGIVVGIAAFFAAAFVSSSVAVLILCAALALVITTAWLSTRTARNHVQDANRRRWTPCIITAATLALAATASAWFVFRPMAVALQPKLETSQTRYWDLPTGSRIAYTHSPALGKPRATPVILLHGGPGVPGRFEVTLLERTLTRAGFEVYRYDQIGAGLSARLDNAGEYTVARHVADIEAIRVSIGAERVVLIGGSWGATLAANYMARYPMRVARAVMSGPGPIWVPAFGALGAASQGPERALIWQRSTPRFVIAFALLQINPRAAQAFAGDAEMSGFFQQIVGGVISSDVGGCGADGNAAPVAAQPRLPQGFGFYANMVTSADAGRINDPRPQLKGNQTPMLVLRGRCERLRWAVAREYRDTFKNAVLLNFAESGHSIESTQPALQAEAIRTFLLGEKLPLEPYTGNEAPK